MRALITASFDPESTRRLERHMSVVHEDWKRDMKMIVDCVETYLADRRPPFIWNPEVLERASAPRPA
jgi:hypothetical protein